MTGKGNLTGVRTAMSMTPLSFDLAMSISVTVPIRYRTIRFWTYLILNLSDSEPIWFWTYLILNLSDSEPIWFWTYLIPNLSDSESIWFQRYMILNLSDIEPIWYWTHLILNPSDTEPISSWTWDPVWGPPLCAVLVSPSSFYPEMTVNPSKHALWQNWGSKRWTPVPSQLKMTADLPNTSCGEIGDQTGQSQSPLPFLAHND